jgi:hypothetical protein
MANTSYGHFLVQQKRDAEWAYQKMSIEEEVDFKRKMAEIDKAGADDGQYPPPSLTPIQLRSINYFKLLFYQSYAF